METHTGSGMGAKAPMSHRGVSKFVRSLAKKMFAKCYQRMNLVLNKIGNSKTVQYAQKFFTSFPCRNYLQNNLQQKYRNGEKTKNIS